MTSFNPCFWDNVKNNSTYFFRDDINQVLNYCVNNTPTIFLRANKGSELIEKAWIGKVHSIKATQGIVYFSFHIDSRVEIDSEFKRLKKKWCIIKSEIDMSKIIKIE